TLHGTLFRNGPGLLDVNGQRIHHPFDGDGMVCAIAFHNGRAHFRNRFVKTAGYLAEQKAGRILYRGVFGTQKPGGWLANIFDLGLKNIANTQVIYWGSKLLALWEAAEPYRLDPHTLETLGLEYFDGQLSPGDAFAAHPRIDPGDGTREPRLVNFSIKPGLSTAITVYELNLAGQIVETYTHYVPGFAFIHDFVITPRYCIFFQNPVDFNPLPYVFGLRGAGECLRFHPERPTRVIVIPRPHSFEADEQIPSQPYVLETQAGFVFHHANAFAQGDRLVVDSVCYASFPELQPGTDFEEVDFAALPPGQLWRFQLDLTNKTVDRHLLEPRCCEFPYVHPQHVGRNYRYVYLGAAHAPTGNAPLQGILKVDLHANNRQFWSAAPHGFVGEPVFVPRPDATTEDDGWLLTLVYDSKRDRSDLVILDAHNLDRGTIACLHLSHHIPYGLHGTFTPECFGITVL
ncbi:MAG: carotenoid oxygenase family protein, partial [Cyanobacteria bacterium]|nr:carotenoid oxygenase family protein [Cyanobacteriota bacterium]MDW8203191.1 carotenoid oxygenase family protein [Cyanobacteriota bacterium SKYGB_h_bin112]